MRTATTPAVYDHWVVIVEENHSRTATVGHMPYLDSLLAKCGNATNMTAEYHPSLPNYMAMTGGTNAGITSDCSPATSCQSTAQSIFTQVGAANAYTFAQTMGTACKLTTSGAYAVKHNPETYYTQDRTGCATNNLRPKPTPGEDRFGWTTQGELHHP